MDMKVISGDSHVNEPPNVFQERLPEPLRDIGPKIVACDDGGEGWTWEGRKPASFGLNALAGKTFEHAVNAGLKFADIRPGNYEPNEFLNDQDLDGVDGSILFPGTAMGFVGIQNKELRVECMKAYNDWIIDDFCSADLRRLFALAMLPVDDEVELAVAEMERSVKKGHRGAIIPTWPEVQYDDPRYEPLWTAAERLDIPLFFHRAIGRGFGSDNTNVRPFVARIVWMWFACIPALTTLIFSGVFSRHPRLTVIAGEENFGWMPFWSEQADDQFRRQKSWSNLTFEEYPSAYIKRQVGTTFLEDHAGVRVLDLCPVDNLLWSSDYPHSTTLWPNSRDFIGSMLGNVDEKMRRKLLAGNAMRLLHLTR